MLSYLALDSDTFQFLENQLLKLNKNGIINKINLLIALYTENFVYSPKKWDVLSKEEKKEFLNMFASSTTTLKEPEDLIKEPKFNLFI